ncbi:hypothetical protein [Candidatus Venteria ishoeyi]|uniref:Uncharacterized protein n=1 Tax=Candidatus Venteria ishoeyi TaxID=1899563 RepID=A0A1H6FFB3_9GAMM|nr:hypothetical protein [Candidatus Venteria ishoeyi]SEH08760.1 Uncharacterised protein [Candidatus Venteria ishoeyi]
MSTYYLRIEGINLYQNLGDSDQISVIRGGSLLLREAMQTIKHRFSQLDSISTGASIGFFSFTADAEKAAEIQQAVVALLNKDVYQHLTFTVDTHLASAEGFLFDKEAILAKNRFHQMRQLTVAVPAPNAHLKVNPCALGNLHPATTQIKIKKKARQVCPSIKQRHYFGKRGKWKFYEEETGEKQVRKTTLDLGQIAAPGTAHDPKRDFANLNRKIAVIYLDGNGFGKIQNKYCKTPQDLQNFDQQIQQQRQTFLTQLLDKMNADVDCITLDDRLRIETLLWGGDELTLVLPAWKGLEILAFFYHFPWQFKPKPGMKPITLTHAGGIVFCQASTPIQRIDKLSRDLAESVKDMPEGRKQNLFEYAVLESIDFPTESIPSFRQRQFGNLHQSRRPLKPLDEDKLAKARVLREEIPKGQAYTLARMAVNGESMMPGLKRLDEVIEADSKDIEQQLECIFPEDSQCWQWLHLVELWDYLDTPSKQEVLV